MQHIHRVLLCAGGLGHTATGTCSLPPRSSQPPRVRPECAACQVGRPRLGGEPGRGQRGLPGGETKLALPGGGAGDKGNSQRDSMGEGTKWEREGRGGHSFQPATVMRELGSGGGVFPLRQVVSEVLVDTMSRQPRQGSRASAGSRGVQQGCLGTGSAADGVPMLFLYLANLLMVAGHCARYQPARAP